MTGGAWLCLLAPLVGTILITLGGTRIPRVAAAWIATTSVFVAFGGAVWAFFGLRGSAGATTARSRPRGRGSQSGQLQASACSCSSTR